MATKVEVKQNISKPPSWTNEIVAIVLLGVALLTFLSIVSFNPADLSPNSSSLGNKHNWIGFVGAYLAYFLFSAIGVNTYLIPILTILIGWRVYKSENFYPSLSRIVGYFLFIFSLSGLMWHLISPPSFRGGIVGKFLAETILVSLVGTIGTVILLTILLLISILLITNLSYLSALGGFGLAFENFKIRFGDWFKGYREWRKQRDAEAQARLEKRRESRLENEIEPIKIAKKPTISVGEVTPKIEPKMPTTRAKVECPREATPSCEFNWLPMMGNSARAEV